jgi:hypothetical protein
MEVKFNAQINRVIVSIIRGARGLGREITTISYPSPFVMSNGLESKSDLIPSMTIYSTTL